ncbi:hypothetical protein KFE25_008492 [Diacronema lutheri]|uniref:Spermidine synthase n=1 Tax=Diacronema lutheri TaxID=2081491 RepID=A0A8J5XW16_DIALT|nr:hypothetical protein KFE25_008492 [Diacronema lutheri]
MAVGRRSRSTTLLAVALLPSAALQSVEIAPLAPSPAAVALGARLVDAIDGDNACGAVRVVEHDDGGGVAMRFLGCNGTSVGAAFIRPTHARSQIVYTAMIVQAAAALARPAPSLADGARAAPRRALCLGLGAGAVPRALRARHGIIVDVVERSAGIAAMAARHFAHDVAAGASGRTVLADARELLRGGAVDGRLRGPYDVIVADLFDGMAHRGVGACAPGDGDGGGDDGGGALPLDARALKARWLPTSGEGVLVLNVVAALGARAGPMRAPVERAAAELARAFVHVRAFADHEPTADEAAVPDADDEAADADACNVVFVASDRPLRFPPAAPRRPGSEGDEAWVLGVFEARWELPGLGSRAGWARHVPPDAARALDGAARAAASMAAMQARTLPPGVRALLGAG